MTGRKPRPGVAAAHKRWPGAEWIRGSGWYASVANCRVLTVQLYPTRDAADNGKEFIDRIGCGGLCRREHTVEDLDGS